MIRFIYSFLFVSVLSFCWPALAAPDSMTVTVNVGMGYQLCPVRTPLPDLESAFDCSGEQPDLHKVQLTLQRKPAAQPNWLYYDATYTEPLKFGDFTATAEILVMYAEWDGKKSGFIDGRIITDNKGKKTTPVYFRSTGAGDLSKIGFSTTLGTAVTYTIDGSDHQSEFSPMIAISGQ